MRATIAAGLAWVVFTMPVQRVQAQGTAGHRMRPEHDLNSYGVVETLPGMDQVSAKPLIYKTVDGQALQMDVYAPPGGSSSAAARPAVVFVNGVGDPPG